MTKLLKRKTLLILLIILIMCAICTTAILIKSAAQTGQMVKITSDGRLIELIDLEKSEDKIFAIENELGKNTIKIQDGKISIVESDCPDKICISMGELKSELMPIVCLPHKLIISFTEKTVEN